MKAEPGEVRTEPAGRWLFAALSVLVLAPTAIALFSVLAQVIQSGFSSAPIYPLLGAVILICLWWYVWDGVVAIRRVIGAYALVVVVLLGVSAVSGGFIGGLFIVNVAVLVGVAVVLNTPNPVTRYLDARRALFEANEPRGS